MSSAGDVNGDGFDDVVLGENYVVFGRADGFDTAMNLDSLTGDNGFKLQYEDLSGGTPIPVGSADMNGDGFDDLIVGDIRANEFAGRTYVVFGKPDGFDAIIHLGSLDGDDGFQIDGVESDDATGSAVSNAGDVNGDGLDDLIIGVEPFNLGPKGSTPGYAYVVFGNDTGFGASMNLSSLDGANGFRLDGVAESDHSGLSVSGAGDFNADGYEDIIIGAMRADPNDKDEAGSCYVVFGRPGGFAATMNLSTLDGDNGFRLDGENRWDYSGQAVSGAGDVNNDGFDDIIIGAPGADPDPNLRWSHGAAYVVFGDDRVELDVQSISALTSFGSGVRLGKGDDVLQGYAGALANWDGAHGRFDGGPGSDRLFEPAFFNASSDPATVTRFEQEIDCPETGCFVGGDVTTDLLIHPTIGNILIVKGKDHFDHDLQLSSNQLGQVTLESIGYGATIDGAESLVTFENIDRVKVLLGSGTDTVLATGLQLSDKLIVKTGLGNDNVQIVGGQLGKLKIDTGGGSDTVLLDSTTVDRRTKIVAGWGEDEVTIRDSIFGRKLILEGGLDEDTLELLGENLFAKGYEEDFEL